MELINNTTKTLRDDLAVEIKQGSRLSVAAACFSIYAFQELKKELQGIDELRFIFTSPTFTTEKAKKEKREFYIPRLSRERSLYGTEFEVKLRNELTQKAIAKECAEWIRKKVTFKSNVTNENMMGFINLDDKNYMPINGFTTVDLGCERGNNAYNMVQKTEAPFSTAYIDLFDNLWNDTSKLQEVTDEVIENITAAYNENSPDFIYFVTLYNIFSEFLEDVSEDHRMFCQMRQQALKKARYGLCFTTSRRMLFLQLSVNWKNTMAVSLLIVWVLVKPLPLWLLLNITKTGINLCSSSVRRS